MSDAPVTFLVPSPHLGRTEDIHPERIQAGPNDWAALSREVLKKRRKVAAQHPRALAGTEGDAPECALMHEADSLGFLLKWPATAILKQVKPGSWVLKTSTNFNFYSYSPRTSFAEAGEAEVISVDAGWMVATPPGWSVLLKNLPNNLFGSVADGLTLAEGVVRADLAAIPLVTHAYIRPGAPKEIKIKRGEPMAVLVPFRREPAPMALAVMEDRPIVEEAAALLAGRASPAALYERMLADWTARPR